jgi:hypothetical protein
MTSIDQIIKNGNLEEVNEAVRQLIVSEQQYPDDFLADTLYLLERNGFWTLPNYRTLMKVLKKRYEQNL